MAQPQATTSYSHGEESRQKKNQVEGAGISSGGGGANFGDMMQFGFSDISGKSRSVCCDMQGIDVLGVQCSSSFEINAFKENLFGQI